MESRKRPAEGLLVSDIEDESLRLPPAKRAANGEAGLTVDTLAPVTETSSSSSSTLSASGSGFGFGSYSKINPFAVPASGPTSFTAKAPKPLIIPSPKSPKTNPFSSASPAHNPFVTIVDTKDNLWSTVAGAATGGISASTSIEQPPPSINTNSSSFGTSLLLPPSVLVESVASTDKETPKPEEFETKANIESKEETEKSKNVSVFTNGGGIGTNTTVPGFGGGFASTSTSGGFSSFTSAAGSNPFASFTSSAGASSSSVFGFGCGSKNDTNAFASGGTASVFTAFATGAGAASSSFSAFRTSSTTNDTAAAWGSIGATNKSSGGAVNEEEGDEKAADENNNFNPEEEQEPEDYSGDAVFGKVYPMPDNVQVVTGEENEECIMQVRAKLFRLNVPEEKRTASTAVNEGASPSKSISDDHSTSEQQQKQTVKNDDQDRDSVGNSVVSNDTADSSTETKKKDPSTKHAEWIEVGVGPVRLLRPRRHSKSGSSLPQSHSTGGSPDKATTTTFINKGVDGIDEGVRGAVAGAVAATPVAVVKHPRLVMRREDKKGGHGTKLLLNVLIKSYVTAVKQGPNMFRMTCVAVPEDGKGEAVPCVYMFKTKQNSEADRLYEEVSGLITAEKLSAVLSSQPSQ